MSNPDSSRFAPSEAVNLIVASEKISFTSHWYETQTDYSLKNNTALFNDVEVAKVIEIYSSEEIQVKLNSTSNDPMTILADVLYTIDYILVTDIFITTTQLTNVKVLVSGMQRATPLTNSYTEPHFYDDATEAGNDNMLAYWSLNGNSNDPVGSHDGTDTDISYVSGKFGNCAGLDGSTSHIAIPSHADFNQMPGLSISVWINSDDYSNDMGIIDHDSELFRLYWKGPDSQIYFHVRGVPLTRIAIYDVVLTTGVWYHIVGTWVAGGAPKIYLNGTLKATAGSTLPSMRDAQNSLDIGRKDSGNNPFDGKFDDMGIWDRELTANEIEFLYESGNPIIQP
jgi:hypothetical protein